LVLFKSVSKREQTGGKGVSLSERFGPLFFIKLGNVRTNPLIFSTITGWRRPQVEVAGTKPDFRFFVFMAAKGNYRPISGPTSRAIGAPALPLRPVIVEYANKKRP
jgi:hypothetical protein